MRPPATESFAKFYKRNRSERIVAAAAQVRPHGRGISSASSPTVATTPQSGDMLSRRGGATNSS